MQVAGLAAFPVERRFIRLLGLDSNRPAEGSLQMYEEAMVLTSKLDEKKMVLSGLANMKSLAALEMAADYLGDKFLRQEAEAAVIKIAEAIYSVHPEQSKTVLEKILQISDNDLIRKQAQDVIGQIEQRRTTP